jgi:hypothetical protein
MVGWIARDGSFIECEPGKHTDVLSAHFPDSKDPEKEASLHWIKVAKNLTDGKFCIGFYRPSKAQLTALYDWCVANNYPYPLS